MNRKGYLARMAAMHNPETMHFRKDSWAPALCMCDVSVSPDRQRTFGPNFVVVPCGFSVSSLVGPSVLYIVDRLESGESSRTADFFCTLEHPPTPPLHNPSPYVACTQRSIFCYSSFLLIIDIDMLQLCACRLLYYMLHTVHTLQIHIDTCQIQA